MEFSLNRRETKTFEMIKNTKSRGRHSLRNAWYHLEKAWRIRSLDPAMAMFRGLTAEEEAATGLIYALRDRRYGSANLLNPYNHPHKHSIHAFLEILSDWFAEFVQPMGLDVNLGLGSKDDPDRLKIRFKINLDGKDYIATPDPPFNWKVSVDGKPISFQQHVKKLATVRNAKRIDKYLQTVANERNRLLYAAPQGYPHVESVSDEFFPHQKNKVMSMAYAYLLIEPYKEKQPFVQQALDALLKMLRRTEATHLHDEF
jgi:hypothetical protein